MGAARRGQTVGKPGGGRAVRAGARQMSKADALRLVRESSSLATGQQARLLLSKGLNARRLAALGMGPKELLKANISLPALRQLGFYAVVLVKELNWGARELRLAGFTVLEAMGAGCGLRQIIEAGFKDKQLFDARIRAPGLRAIGLDARALLARGHSVYWLRRLGFRLPELVEAGCSEELLKQAGFSPSAVEKAFRARR